MRYLSEDCDLLTLDGFDAPWQRDLEQAKKKHRKLPRHHHRQRRLQSGE